MAGDALLESLKILVPGGGLAAVAAVWASYRKGRAEDVTADANLQTVINGMVKEQLEYFRAEVASARAAAEHSREEIERERTDNRALRGEIRTLQERVDALEGERDRARDDRAEVARALRDYMTWQTSGAVPPPPSLSRRVRDLIDKH